MEATDYIEQLHKQRQDLERKLTEERDMLDKLAQALLSGPFAGDKHSRRDRMYGSSWAAVHDVLDAWESRRKMA